MRKASENQRIKTMKRTLTTILTVILLCSLTACGKSENQSEVSGGASGETSLEIGSNESTVTNINVKAVTENYDADFESCKNTSYINLD